MTQSKTRPLLNPVAIVVPSLVGVIFLLANVTPRVQCEQLITADRDIVLYSDGDLYYGWPKLAEVDTIEQASNQDQYSERQFSINHLLGWEEFKVLVISRSESAMVSNAVLGISTVLLLAITIQSISTRRTSIRLLFAAITLVGVITASIVAVCPLQ